MNWLGREIADPSGDRYARLDDVFVGRTSGKPDFGIVTLLGEGEGGRVVIRHEEQLP